LENIRNLGAQKLISSKGESGAIFPLDNGRQLSPSQSIMSGGGACTSAAKCGAHGMCAASGESLNTLDPIPSISPL